MTLPPLPTPNTGEMAPGFLWVFGVAERLFYFGLVSSLLYLRPNAYFEAKTVSISDEDWYMLVCAALLRSLVDFSGAYSFGWHHAVGALPPQQSIYTTVDQARSPVLLAETGAAGRWNRAQRAISNLHEYGFLALFSFLAALRFYPFLAFVGMLIFLLARFPYIVMYSREAAGRGAGFGITTLMES